MLTKIRIIILFCCLWLNSVYGSQLLSLDFNAIATRDLIQLLAQFAHKNVIISDAVTGKITIKLDQVTWDEALTLILHLQGLVKHEGPHVIFIAPANTFLVPQAALIKLQHTEATELAEILNKQPDLGGKVNADQRTNSLLVQAAPEKINAIRTMVKNLDIPAKQILIKAIVVNGDDNFMRELGIKFGALKDSGKTDAAADFDPGHFDFALAHFSSGALAAEVAVLENAGHAKIISNPKLLTINSKPARIEAGAEIPYQEKTSGGATNVAFKKAVLSLQVTPEIIAHNINLMIELNQDKVSELIVNGVPAIDTRAIKTQVLLKSGETIVLGGIYEYSKNNTITRVPFLGSIPGLGLLFTHKQIRNERKELLIFVTPEIVE